MEFENLGYMAMRLVKAGKTAEMRNGVPLEMITAVKMQRRTMKTSGRYDKKYFISRMKMFQALEHLIPAGQLLDLR
jgi:hypothetical protein